MIRLARLVLAVFWRPFFNRYMYILQPVEFQGSEEDWWPADFEQVDFSSLGLSPFFNYFATRSAFGQAVNLEMNLTPLASG